MKRKNILLEVISLILISVLVAFQSVQSSVIGKITPSDAADAVMAIAKNDTLRTSMRATITNGRFAMDVKPGIYKIIVDTRDPYQDVILDDIEVKPGQTTDLGDIRVQ
jgi:hypothetical protein